ncbi:MAG TPA: hypothetical protein VGO58_15250 [Chitinophagaceae bacterium]|jgi:hypothetical protein|nr:hypothetical protein [Chitinophagaceae bacterium]
MEINPAGVIVAFLLLLIAGVFAAMFLLLVLQSLHIIRFRKNSHFIISSIGGGILLLFVFWLIKTSPWKQTKSPSIKADTVADTIATRPATKDTPGSGR